MTIAEIGLMTGAADHMMQFPAGTTFTPYSVLRNVSNAPLSLTPKLWWMESGAAHSAQLPSITLRAYETRGLDVSSMLAQFGPKNFNGNFNLVFDGEVRRGSLVMSSGSVDQTNTYVFEVDPRGVGESMSKTLQYWSTANGDDTMVSLWNPADEAQDFAFTLYFNGGHYVLPVHLEARETRSLNVSEVIQNQVPDADGNIIPPSVHEGTAKIAGIHAATEAILVAIQAGIYNVRKATCGLICAGCTGFAGVAVVANPFTVTAGGTQQLSFVATDGSGNMSSLLGSFSSSDTKIATVGTGSGVVTGVSAGSVSITATSNQQPLYIAYGCDKPEFFTCPKANLMASASGTVLQACPSSVALASSTTISLASQFPGLKTGVGIVASMQVSPATQPNGHSWNGTLIAESLVTATNTCAQWGVASCSAGAPFTVGTGGIAFGQVFAPTTNVFYDQHVATSSTSALSAPGAPSSCTQSCTQQYSCNGTTIGNFILVRTLTLGQIQGTPVTNVSETKH